MIGVSLPLKWLESGDGILGDVDHVLTELTKHNVKSIELRTVRSHSNANEVLRVANILWDRGFSITVHSYPTSLSTAVDDVFVPLEKLLQSLRQERLTITIHPIDDDNVAMLNALADYRDAHDYPITIAVYCPIKQKATVHP